MRRGPLIAAGAVGVAMAAMWLKEESAPVAAVDAPVSPTALDPLESALGVYGPPQEDLLVTLRPRAGEVEAFLANHDRADLVLAPETGDVPQGSSAWHDATFVALRLGILGGWDLAAQGNLDGAVNRFLALSRSGARIRRAATDLNVLWMGQRIQWRAVRERGELLDSSARGSRSALQLSAVGLAAVLSIPVDPESALLGECIRWEARLPYMEAHRAEIFYGSRGPSPFEAVRDHLGAVLLYDHADAVSRLRERCDERVRDALLPVARRGRTALPPLFHGEKFDIVEYSDNPIARVFVSLLDRDDFAAAVTKDEITHVRTALLLTVVAARGHALDHGGRLPADPEKGLPGWLDAMPLDPYGGRIRLDATHAWSHGDDPSAHAVNRLRLAIGPLALGSR